LRWSETSMHALTHSHAHRISIHTQPVMCSHTHSAHSHTCTPMPLTQTSSHPADNPLTQLFHACKCTRTLILCHTGPMSTPWKNMLLGNVWLVLPEAKTSALPHFWVSYSGDLVIDIHKYTTWWLLLALAGVGSSPALRAICFCKPIQAPPGHTPALS
jgi:hypothetical protein